MSLTTKTLSLPDAANLLDTHQPRTTDLWHVTDLINEAAKVINPKYHYESTQEENGIMALGRILEWAVRPFISKVAWEEGYTFFPQVIMEANGVVGTLDGVLESPTPTSGSRVSVVVEIKSRHSSPSDPTNNWRWMAQVKAYCALAKCTSLWMPVLYLPKSPPDAILQLHRITFTEEEIAENWAMLLSVKESLENATIRG